MQLGRRSIICHLIAISAGVGLALFLGLLFDRKPVVELDSAASHVSPNPARMGKTVSITWSATPKRNCSGFVIPRVIDSTGRIYEYARAPAVYQDLIRPGEHSFTKTLTLPELMAPGRARYEAVVVRWCNPVQQYIWPMIDAPFPIPFEVEK